MRNPRPSIVAAGQVGLDGALRKAAEELPGAAGARERRLVPCMSAHNALVNAPLLSALMKQWGQRVDQALADELRWTDPAAWARRYPYVAAGIGLPTAIGTR
jgi:hypothetical protein